MQADAGVKSTGACDANVKMRDAGSENVTEIQLKIAFTQIAWASQNMLADKRSGILTPPMENKNMRSKTPARGRAGRYPTILLLTLSLLFPALAAGDWTQSDPDTWPGFTDGMPKDLTKKAYKLFADGVRDTWKATYENNRRVLADCAKKAGMTLDSDAGDGETLREKLDATMGTPAQPVDCPYDDKAIFFNSEDGLKACYVSCWTEETTRDTVGAIYRGKKPKIPTPWVEPSTPGGGSGGAPTPGGPGGSTGGGSTTGGTPTIPDTGIDLGDGVELSYLDAWRALHHAPKDPAMRGFYFYCIVHPDDCNRDQLDLKEKAGHGYEKLIRNGLGALAGKYLAQVGEAATVGEEDLAIAALQKVKEIYRKVTK